GMRSQTASAPTAARRASSHRSAATATTRSTRPVPYACSTPYSTEPTTALLRGEHRAVHGHVHGAYPHLPCRAPVTGSERHARRASLEDIVAGRGARTLDDLPRTPPHGWALDLHLHGRNGIGHLAVAYLCGIAFGHGTRLRAAVVAVSCGARSRERCKIRGARGLVLDPRQGDALRRDHRDHSDRRREHDRVHRRRTAIRLTGTSRTA